MFAVLGFVSGHCYDDDDDDDDEGRYFLSHCSGQTKKETRLM